MNDEKSIKQPEKISKKTETPTRPIWQRLLAIALIIIIFAIGIGIAKYLMVTKPTTRKRPPQKTVTTVKVIPLTLSDSYISVSGIGTVIPAKEVSLQALVSGTAIYINPKLIPGGIIKKGETAIKIDNADYKIKKILSESSLKKIIADLEIEKGQQAIAANEWRLIKEYSNDNISISTSNLALRKPQLDKIKASIIAAKAELEQTKLNLQRTSLIVPFNSIVSEKNINIGSQIISTQTIVAKLTGIDEYWIEILLPTYKLPYLNIKPGKNMANLPDVNITYLGSKNTTIYKGKILKLLSSVDSKGLMASILISVKDPLGLKNDLFPLLLGSSVKAEIKGKQLIKYFKIPRSAISDNGKIMIATKNNSLEIRNIAIEWKSKDWVYIKNGITENERLITSKISAPVNGMPIKIYK